MSIFRSFVLVGAVFFGTPACAGTAEAMAYNDRVVGTTWRAVEEMLAMASSGYDASDLEAVAARLAEFRGILARERAALEAVRPYKDDALRTTLLHEIDVVDGLVSHELTDALAVLGRSLPTDADLATAERAFGAFESGAKAAEDRVVAAQTAFAKRSGFMIVDPDDPPWPETFEEPSIVPSGSVMPAAMHASLLMAYRNEVVSKNNELLEVNNALAGALPNLRAFEAARKDGVARLDAVVAWASALEPFRGDATLKSATLTQATEMRTIFAGDLATYSQLGAKGRLTKAQAQKARGAYDRASKALQAAAPRLSRALEAYDRKWKIHEFDAWSRAHGVGAPGETMPAPSATTTGVAGG